MDEVPTNHSHNRKELSPTVFCICEIANNEFLLRNCAIIIQSLQALAYGQLNEKEKNYDFFIKPDITSWSYSYKKGRKTGKSDFFCLFRNHHRQLIRTHHWTSVSSREQCYISHAQTVHGRAKKRSRCCTVLLRSLCVDTHAADFSFGKEAKNKRQKSCRTNDNQSELLQILSEVFDE